MYLYCLVRKKNFKISKNNKLIIDFILKLSITKYLYNINYKIIYLPLDKFYFLLYYDYLIQDK